MSSVATLIDAVETTWLPEDRPFAGLDTVTATVDLHLDGIDILPSVIIGQDFVKIMMSKYVQHQDRRARANAFSPNLG